MMFVPEIRSVFRRINIDTGVQRQPQESLARAEDFRDDYTHARRCIAGVVASSEYFLNKLREHRSPTFMELRPFIMRLMTNTYDRGSIQVHPIDNETVNVVVIIGGGANRTPKSSPKIKDELTYEGIDVSGTSIQTERALKALHSNGPALLKTLTDRSSH